MIKGLEVTSLEGGEIVHLINCGADYFVGLGVWLRMIQKLHEGLKGR